MQCDYFDAGRCRSCTLMGHAVRRAAGRQAGASGRRARRRSRPASGGSTRRAARSRATATRPSSSSAAVPVRRRSASSTSAGAASTCGAAGSTSPGWPPPSTPCTASSPTCGLEPYDVPARRGELKYLIVTHSPDGEHLVRFVLRSERHLADAARRPPAPARRAAVGAGGHRQPAPGAQGGARGRHRGRADRADPAADAGRRRHPPARAASRSSRRTPSVAGRAVPPGPRVGRRRRPGGRLGPLLRGGWLRPARHRAGPHRGRRRDLRRGGRGRPGRGRTTRGCRGPGIRAEPSRSRSATPRPSPPPLAPDLVVVNPPRRGIGPALAGWLESSTASRVLYSSCNVDSLARDLAAMPSLRPVQGRVFDMFPQTPHPR